MSPGGTEPSPGPGLPPSPFPEAIASGFGRGGTLLIGAHIEAVVVVVALDVVLEPLAVVAVGTDVGVLLGVLMLAEVAVIVRVTTPLLDAVAAVATKSPD